MQDRPHSLLGKGIENDYQNIKQTIFEEAKKKIENLEKAKYREKNESSYESLETEFRKWLVVVTRDLLKFECWIERSNNETASPDVIVEIYNRLDLSTLLNKNNIDYGLFRDLKLSFEKLEETLDHIVAKAIAAADKELTQNDSYQLLLNFTDNVTTRLSAIEGRLSTIEASLKNLPSAQQTGSEPNKLTRSNSLTFLGNK